MSLQLIAKQMEAKGRNGDSVLVHMTTGEVAGLQKLAENAGGSLSVNPETGLVEASFLKSILPTLVGAGVSMFAGPMAGAAAGAAIGGYQARRSGQDVGMGALMGGLGGYGGSQLTAGAGFGAGAKTLTEKQMLRSGLMALAPTANAPMQQQQQGQYPLMSMDINRSSIPFQNIQAYAPPMPRYTGGGGNVYIPQFRGAEGGSVGGDSGGSDMVLTDDAARSMLGKFPTMQKLIGQLSPATMKRLGVAQQKEAAPAPAPAPRRSSPEFRAYEPEMPQYKFENGTYVPTFRAAEGGLMSLAKGGVTSLAEGGAFEDLRAYEGVMPSYSYVDGNFLRATTQPTTPVRPQGLLARLASPEVSQPRVVAPVIRPPMSQPMLETGRGDGYAPNADFDTPEKQAAFYAENPTMGSFTRALQTPLGYFMDPQDFQREQNLTLGVTAAPSAGSGYVGGTDINDAEMAGISSNAVSQQAGEDVGGDPVGDGESLAQGGLLGLARGGMKQGGFVVPADVVSMVGEGNTDAGYRRIMALLPGATPIKGKDGGQSDTVKTNIEGKQPARVAHGEMYIPPEVVKKAGGAKKLYAMMDKVRQQATGSKKQIKPVRLERAMA